MHLRTGLTLILLLSLASTPIWGHQEQVQKEEPKGEPAVTAQKRTGPGEETTRNYFTDLPLVTQEGTEVRFYTDVLKDKVVLINFIYTNCRDTCPLVTQKLIQVKDSLGDLLGEQVYFVSISTDPTRDTPPALAKFAKQQKAEHPGWVFLTGSQPNVKTILSKLGQYTAQPEAHSTLMLAGNVRTRHWMKIVPMAPVPVIAMQLQQLASES
ncbi:MAG: SCO family protein [Planctomycetota bacterium]|jgi:cytochrome oxidase Cu insertion factor (SCO1/SenC/PrrC family)